MLEWLLDWGLGKCTHKKNTKIGNSLPVQQQGWCHPEGTQLSPRERGAGK